MKALVMEAPVNLLELSSLTAVQLESLLAYQRVESHEMTLKQAAEGRTTGPVRIGSFYRTVVQGRRNLKASISTLTLALWLGLVKTEELRRLLDQVGRGIPDLDSVERERLEGVIIALIEQIVM